MAGYLEHPNSTITFSQSTQRAKNKIALITGAGTGLGKAIAITLAKEGYDVVLTGRREEKLRETEKEIKESRVFVITADVTKEESVQELHKKLLEQTEGRLDLLINNVGGVSSMDQIEDLSVEDWHQIIDTNLTSQFLVTKAFLPELRKSGHGKIISITSQMSSYYMNGYGAYSAAKAGVDALMKTVAVEEKDNGIEVHLFDPGNVFSEASPQGKDPMEVMDGVIELL